MKNDYGLYLVEHRDCGDVGPRGRQADTGWALIAKIEVGIRKRVIMSDPLAEDKISPDLREYGAETPIFHVISNYYENSKAAPCLWLLIVLLTLTVTINPRHHNYHS
jgi:hypothetical protein